MGTGGRVRDRRTEQRHRNRDKVKGTAIASWISKNSKNLISPYLHHCPILPFQNAAHRMQHTECSILWNVNGLNRETNDNRTVSSGVRSLFKESWKSVYGCKDSSLSAQYIMCSNFCRFTLKSKFPTIKIPQTIPGLQYIIYNHYVLILTTL